MADPSSQPPPSADVKPEGGGGGEEDYITLKVAGQDGGVVQFKTKRTTQLKKLMKAYCDRQGVVYQNVRFVFDGQRIQETTTPDDLELESGDQIDAMVEQLGGAAAA